MRQKAIFSIGNWIAFKNIVPDMHIMGKILDIYWYFSPISGETEITIDIKELSGNVGSLTMAAFNMFLSHNNFKWKLIK